MPTPSSRHSRPLTLAAAALGLVSLAGVLQAGVVQAAPTAAAPVAAPPPSPPPTPPPLAGPKGSNESKPRMWAVNLSNMVVYENGSGYLYGFFRDFGAAQDVPARLYWGRGCPEISERVYHVLQTGFSRQGEFYLIVDRHPDPRQAGAFCVRGVELETRGPAAPPPLPIAAPPSSPPPAPRPAPPVAGGK